MTKHSKTLTVTHRDGKTQDLTAETVEHALRDLAKKVKHGEIEVPFTLEFDGPSGLRFTVTVESADAAQEMTAFGFMF